MDTTAVILGDVAGISTGNVAAGIHGRTTAVDVFANVCGPCAFALGCMRRTAVQEFADWSRDLCMLALSLRWTKLRWMCISLQQLALTTTKNTKLTHSENGQARPYARVSNATTH